MIDSGVAAVNGLLPGFPSGWPSSFPETRPGTTLSKERVVSMGAFGFCFQNGIGCFRRKQKACKFLFPIVSVPVSTILPTAGAAGSDPPGVSVSVGWLYDHKVTESLPVSYSSIAACRRRLNGELTAVSESFTKNYGTDS